MGSPDKNEFELPQLLLSDDDETAVMQHLALNVDAYLSKLKCFQMIVGCFFGDWEICLQHAQDLKKANNNKTRQHFTSVEYTFFAGLVAFVAASSCTYRRRRKHIAEGRKRLKTMQRWWHQGATDCAPMVAILEAEEQVVVLRKGASQDDRIVQMYQAAILKAKSGEFTHLAALATERLATVLRERGFEAIDALVYYQEAKVLYNDWGALAKVKRLDLLVGGLL
jgi:hypothetical protein